VLLVDRLDQALARLDRHRATIGVLFLDLDRFKMVNDSRGHAAGDHVLQEVARRLSATVRRGDTVARFGGDEFVILCENLTGDEVIRSARREDRNRARATVRLRRTRALPQCSIGIATSDDWRRGAEELVRDADSAM
jgi:diguanylate cyclase (GGDEF)-like protein